MALLLASRIKRKATGDNGITRITETWRCVCEPGDRENVALAGLGVSLYDPHPDYPTAVARTADADLPGPEGWVWDITYNYSSEPFQQGVSGGQDAEQLPPSSDPATTDDSVAPEDRPWLFSYSSTTVPEVMRYDALGAMVLNSSFQEFVPPPEIERPHRVMKLTAWKPAAWDAGAKADAYYGKVNNAAWGRWAKWEAKCTEFAVSTEREQNTTLWRVDITVEVAPTYTLTDGRKLGAWQPVWLNNRGTIEKNVAGKFVPIKDDDTGRPIQSPVFLNRTTGRRATEAEILADTGPDNANPTATNLHLPYYPYFEADFSQMLAD